MNIMNQLQTNPIPESEVQFLKKRFKDGYMLIVRYLI